MRAADLCGGANKFVIPFMREQIADHADDWGIRRNAERRPSFLAPRLAFGLSVHRHEPFVVHAMINHMQLVRVNPLPAQHVVFDRLRIDQHDIHKAIDPVFQRLIIPPMLFERAQAHLIAQHCRMSRQFRGHAAIERRRIHAAMHDIRLLALEIAAERDEFFGVPIGAGRGNEWIIGRRSLKRRDRHALTLGFGLQRAASGNAVNARLEPLPVKPRGHFDDIMLGPGQRQCSQQIRHFDFARRSHHEQDAENYCAISNCSPG